MINAFGIDDGAVSKTAPNGASKKKQTGYGVVGTVAGSQAGRRLGPRAVGSSFKDVTAMTQSHVNLAADRGEVHTAGGAFKTAAKTMGSKVHGGRAALVGDAVGSVAGGVGAVALARRRKAVSKHAFGVDPGYSVSKASDRQPASGGRLVAGALAPGFHAAAAGKKGHKLRAAGWEVGGTAVAPVIGGGVGTAMAHNRGHYKSQKKVSKGANADAVGVLAHAAGRGTRKGLRATKRAAAPAAAGATAGAAVSRKRDRGPSYY